MAAEKLATCRGRWHAVQGDLGRADWSVPINDDRYDLVVSGLCIHHLEHERKRELYEEIFSLLNPGGIFLNMDCVAGSSWSEELFENLLVDAIAAKKRSRGNDRSNAEIREKFLSDGDEDKPLGVKDQCQWLEDIGFDQVDIYFKWLDVALFGGIKPAT